MANAPAAVDLALALRLAFRDKQRVTMLVPPHVVLHAPSATTADALAVIDATGRHKPAGRQSLAQCLVALMRDTIFHVLRVLTFPSYRGASANKEAMPEVPQVDADFRADEVRIINDCGKTIAPVARDPWGEREEARWATASTVPGHRFLLDRRRTAAALEAAGADCQAG